MNTLGWHFFKNFKKRRIQIHIRPKLFLKLFKLLLVRESIIPKQKGPSQESDKAAPVAPKAEKPIKEAKKEKATKEEKAPKADKAEKKDKPAKKEAPTT